MIDNRYATFALLSKNKSYTKTAKELFITQPAVSQQVKSLENELQLKLVEYRHPHLSITPAGQALAQFIETTQHQENQLVQRLQHPAKATTLRVGVTHSVSIFMAPQLLRKWHDRYTHIQCTVANTRTILSQIDTGKLNIGILEGNFDKSLYSSQTITTEDFVAVTRASSPLAQRSSLTLTDLLDEPLLLRENGSGTRKVFEDWASAFNVKKDDFAQVIEFGSSGGIVNLLQSLGVSFMYRSLVNPQLADQSLVTLPIKGLDISRPIAMVYAKNSFFENEYRQLL